MVQREGDHVFLAENLVVLSYAMNTLYTNLHTLDLNSLPDTVLEVDLRNGEWFTDSGDDPGIRRLRAIKIGKEMRHCDHGCRWGVIGIYDRTKISHLSMMISHAHSATRSRGSFLDN